jgi:Protein of unknown function (DUF3261)
VQRLIAAAAAALALAGCASAPATPSHEPPQLRLAPALLGRSLNLQQHLALQAPGHDQQFDVLLEADARHVQLGVLAMGQVAARLDWDGTTLTEEKAPWWPQDVSGARILSDLQLTLWPVSAIQAALPAGWQLAEDGNVRTLTQDGQVVTVVTRLSPLLIELDERRAHFKLRIESRELGNDGADAS